MIWGGKKPNCWKHPNIQFWNHKPFSFEATRSDEISKEFLPIIYFEAQISGTINHHRIRGQFLEGEGHLPRKSCG